MAVKVVLMVVYFMINAFIWPQTVVASVQSNNCRFCAIYNFGDSNSDTGGNSAAFRSLGPPNGKTFFGKPAGRYGDGRLIIDFIAEKLGLPYLHAYLDSIGADFFQGANFAVSGSTIQHQDEKLCAGGFNPITLDVQVKQFSQFKNRSLESYFQGKCYESKMPLPTPECFSMSLFTLDGGQNDLTAGLDSTSEEQVKASIPNIINQFSVDLEQLYNQGARAFWIHNTGPIGCLPYFLGKRAMALENADAAGCIKSYNEVAQEFNKQLKENISQLRSQLQDALLIYVDMYSAKYSLIRQGKDNGFPDPLGICCGSTLSAFDCGKTSVVNGTEVYVDACSNPSDYISWDGIHYNEAANKWIANKILDGCFSDPQIPITEACIVSSETTRIHLVDYLMRDNS